MGVFTPMAEESYESLLEDVALLLEGSRGRIGFVVIIKLSPLGSRQTTMQSGFLEV